MPGSFSNYAESGVLGHLFLTASLTKPAVVAVALCANVPADTDTGALTSKELASAGSYARVQSDPGDARWAFSYVNGSGCISNVAALTFPDATADWGWVSGVALCDSASHGGGNYLIGGSLALPKLVSTSDVLRFQAGALQILLD